MRRVFEHGSLKLIIDRHSFNKYSERTLERHRALRVERLAKAEHRLAGADLLELDAFAGKPLREEVLGNAVGPCIISLFKLHVLLGS